MILRTESIPTLRIASGSPPRPTSQAGQGRTALQDSSAPCGLDATQDRNSSTSNVFVVPARRQAPGRPRRSRSCHVAIQSPHNSAKAAMSSSTTRRCPRPPRDRMTDHFIRAARCNAAGGPRENRINGSACGLQRDGLLEIAGERSVAVDKRDRPSSWATSLPNRSRSWSERYRAVRTRVSDVARLRRSDRCGRSCGETAGVEPDGRMASSRGNAQPVASSAFICALGWWRARRRPRW